MPVTGNNQLQILHHALDALNKAAGVHGRVLTRQVREGQGYRADAMVELEANGQRHPYAALIKRVDRFAILREFAQHGAAYGQDTAPLLVTPRITAEAAEQCRGLGLQFIDAVGNAYLHGQGLYVFVKGQRPTDNEALLLPAQDAKRAGTPAHLRAIFVLLCRPALLNAPYRDIAQAAGVALGTIGQVFDDLANRGFITGGKRTGNRILLERTKLIDEWATNYPIKLRPKLNPRRFKAPTPNWWKALEVAQYGAQWGAEVAAAKLTGHLRPNTLTLYLRTDKGQQHLTRLVTTHRLRPDAAGDIEILDAFWAFDDEQTTAETVPPLLACADLIATLDPRNLEAAKLIHDQYLAPTQTTA